MDSNFKFLEQYWPDLAEIGKAAEIALYQDCNTSVYKIGLLAERIAQQICEIDHIEVGEYTTQSERLQILRKEGILPNQIDEIFYTIRKARNQAVHVGFQTLDKTKSLLHLAYQLSGWFMEVYGDWNFVLPPFQEVEAKEFQMDDFKKFVQEQDKKIETLMEEIESIKTAASEKTQEERVQKGEERANEIELTEKEKKTIDEEEIRLNVQSFSSVNYALQQNGMNCIQSIVIENKKSEPIENVELKIESMPKFLAPFSHHIESIPAHESIMIRTPKIMIDGDLLANTTEKIKGYIKTEILSEGVVLATEHSEIEVLAFDEWGGINLCPEVLTAFITPNHMEVNKILARATEFLGKWTGDTALDGYQSQDVNRVLQQAGAIYASIKEQGIAYANPPASFEKTGQRVRMCEAIIQQKLATCLDISLFYAACLEAIGLFPLLILFKGHITVGLWLIEESAIDTIIDDKSFITKRFAEGVNDLTLIETTCLTSSNDTSFNDARLIGIKELREKEFIFAIDVHRARVNGYHPLPQRYQSDSKWIVEHKDIVSEYSLNAPEEVIKINIPESELNKEAKYPKIVQWERKLLDLGLRNSLVNLKLTRSVLPILTNSLDDLEDALSDGKTFEIFPKPEGVRFEARSFEGLYESRLLPVLKDDFRFKRLHSDMSEEENKKILIDLYRKARKSLEENGANSLYLALGVVKWYENKRSQKAHYAPLILIPVELVRQSANRGYGIRLRDDDPQMNITVLEKMKQEFGIEVRGLNPLPEDEHGVDIRKVLTIIRKAIMKENRWDVLETACLGIFSFSQFVMWNDIKNRNEDLKKNKIVASLISGKKEWEGCTLIGEQKVDESEVFLPVSADASQLIAIKAAKLGNSFVLHGPPGTGKSQTITSMIANILSENKRVLFVAEKMAALTVVQTRLEKIGLGPFCLELHSNKSNKKDIIAQIERTLEIGRTGKSEEYKIKERQLETKRKELDQYAFELHKQLKCGSSLFDLIERYEDLKNEKDCQPFSVEILENFDPETIDEITELIENMIVTGKIVNHPFNHPLCNVRCTNYSQSFKEKVSLEGLSYKKELENIQLAVERLSQGIQYDLPNNFEEVEKLYQISKLLAPWYEYPKSWTKLENPILFFNRVIALAQTSLRTIEIRRNLLTDFSSNFLKQDANMLLNEYSTIMGEWFLAKFFGLNKFSKKLNSFANHPIQKDQIKTILDQLSEYQELENKGNDLLKQIESNLDHYYLGEDTNWNELEKIAQNAKNEADQMFEYFGNYEFLHQYGHEESLRSSIDIIQTVYPKLKDTRNEFVSSLQLKSSEHENWIVEQIEKTQKILSHLNSLKDWVNYQRVVQELEKKKAENIVSFYESGADPKEVIPAYQKTLTKGLIELSIDSSETLNMFSGESFNNTINQYKRLDKEWTNISQKEIYYRLASRLPDLFHSASSNSELGILQRFLRSKGRGKSIRQLFDSIPNLLSRLFPCMLMSPISVAQYLDPAQEPFDMVIFDEASQLPTCKAVGVIARGKDAVIVGDPKQMPPTSFFANNTIDEDNIDLEDLESILDDCLALHMPETHLLWHYRSQHESLIAFSNREFYDDKLLTFPSVNDRETKVSLVEVNGIYGEGKARTNKAEAEAIVKELYRRFQDPMHHKESIGVVTFNAVQQNLIEDLLNEKIAEDPKFEQWVYDSEEPVFIKNLENVQGDERDVILFSITYGKDKTGKVAMRFGPLNLTGGWRRLNVAVSRARSEMVVFSSLKPEQIDLSRTSAEGVAALKNFLEYAQQKKMINTESSLLPLNRQKQNIVLTLQKHLMDKGYRSELNVGHSKFRVDLGIVDPENPNEYLLGIMLDGDNYGMAQTTRDREISQVSVLNNLGWHVMRIWSMDWWNGSEKEVEKVLVRLEEIKEGKKTKKIDTLQKESKSLNEKESNPQSDTIIRTRNSGMNPEKITSFSRMPDKRSSSRISEEYKAYDRPFKIISAEEFNNGIYDRDIQERIKNIINVEGPISETLLTKRILQECGIARAGSKIQTSMQRILGKLKLKSNTENNMRFYWKKDQKVGEYDGYRFSGEGINKREVMDISEVEVINAILDSLFDEIAMQESDLIREGAKRLGYSRLGGNVMAVMKRGLDKARKRKLIEPTLNGSYKMSEEGEGLIKKQKDL